MKKTVLLLASVLVIASCKKNEAAEVTTETTDQTESTQTLPADSLNTATTPVADPAAAATAQPTAQEDLIRTAQSKPLTSLALTAKHHEFGKVKKGDKVSFDYVITNTGNNPLIISEVKPGCGCTAPEFTKEPILPGKTGKVTLSFDSTNFDGMQNKQAEVYANVETNPIVLTFSADVQPK